MTRLNRFLGFIGALFVLLGSEMVFVSTSTSASQGIIRYSNFLGVRLIAQIDFRDDDAIRHTFRKSKKGGHFEKDTPRTRQLIRNVANDPKNFMKRDKWGKDWYAKTFRNGKQVWVQVHKGKITNAGVNNTPVSFGSL
jgi:hypothetical protein